MPIDVQGLARALWLVGKQTLPTAALLLVLLAAAYAACLANPGWKTSRPALDFTILKEHARRARTVPAAQLAFIGDSSCSMGVDVPALQAATGLVSEAFCTAIFSGPAGHAEMLDTLMARGAEPRVLIVMLHPAQFGRQSDWDKRFDEAPADADGWLATALDMLKFEMLSKALFAPLQAGWGQYYGSERGVESVLRNQKGSFIDPNRGLEFRSFEEMVARGTGPAFAPQSFALSETFLQALDRLREAIGRLGRERVLLLVSPIPQSALSPDGARQRQEAAETIASHLGLSPSQIIETPAAYPDVYFSSVMHFNRWGREPFTAELGRLLMEK
jgi:hypothetical protein